MKIVLKYISVLSRESTIATACITSIREILTFIYSQTQLQVYTGCLQMNGAVSKVNKKFISPLTWAQRTPSAAASLQVSHALPAVRFSCLLRGRGVSLQDGVAA